MSSDLPDPPPPSIELHEGAAGDVCERCGKMTAIPGVSQFAIRFGLVSTLLCVPCTREQDVMLDEGGFIDDLLKSQIYFARLGNNIVTYTDDGEEIDIDQALGMARQLRNNMRAAVAEWLATPVP